MQHAGLQYGQATAASHQSPPFAHHVDLSGAGGTTTSSLRQFRKKDGGVGDKSTEVGGVDGSSHIARVPPHNHYPARPNDYFRYQHQYPDFNSPFKEPPSQVKYSEIAETPPQHVDHLSSTLQKHSKEVPKDYMDMCNISQQKPHMKQTYVDNLAAAGAVRQQSYPLPDVASMHHQYLHKEAQVHGYKPESQYQQYPMKYNVAQCRKYPPPENDFLAKLQRLNPSMARSIMSDHHMRESQNAYPVDQNRLYQNQRYYQNNYNNYQYNYNSCNYRNQVPQYPASMSPRHNIHMMNYGTTPQKISPTYPPQYAAPEYSQHYQHRRASIPQEYYQQGCRPSSYIAPEPTDNRTSGGGLRQFIENWAEEEAPNEIAPIFKDARIQHSDTNNEPVFVINSDLPLENVSLVPTENGQFILKTGTVENSVVRIKETTDNNGERTVNLQIVEAKSDCMLQENNKNEETIDELKKDNEKKKDEEKSEETSVIVQNESVIKDMPIIEEENKNEEIDEESEEVATRRTQRIFSVDDIINNIGCSPTQSRRNSVRNEENEEKEENEENEEEAEYRNAISVADDSVILEIGGAWVQLNINEQNGTKILSVLPLSESLVIDVNGNYRSGQENLQNEDNHASSKECARNEANLPNVEENQKNLENTKCSEDKIVEENVICEELQTTEEIIKSSEEDSQNSEEVCQSTEESPEKNYQIEEAKDLQKPEESFQCEEILQSEEKPESAEAGLQSVNQTEENTNLQSFDEIPTEEIQSTGEASDETCQTDKEIAAKEDAVKISEANIPVCEENLQEFQVEDIHLEEACQSEVIIGEETTDEMILDLSDEATFKEISAEEEEEDDEEMIVKKVEPEPVLEAEPVLEKEEKEKKIPKIEERKKTSRKLKTEEKCEVKYRKKSRNENCERKRTHKDYVDFKRECEDARRKKEKMEEETNSKEEEKTNEEALTKKEEKEEQVLPMPNAKEEIKEKVEESKIEAVNSPDLVRTVEEMITLKQLEESKQKELEKPITKAAKKLYVDSSQDSVKKFEEKRQKKKIEETVNKIKSLKEKSEEVKKKKVTFNLETEVREIKEDDKKKLSWEEYNSRKRKSSNEEETKIMEDTVTSTEDMNDEEKVPEKNEKSNNWEEATPSPPSPSKSEVMSTTNRKCLIDVNEFNIKPIESVSTPSPVSSSQFSYSEDDSLQVYKDVVDSKLNSLNIKIPKLSKPKRVEQFSVLFDRFLNKGVLNCEELEKVKKLIEIKRKMLEEKKLTNEVRNKELKLHLKKVPKKKKRFRNLYAETSSDSDSSQSDKGDYSVYQRDSQGVPKLIIKRNPGLPQPFVKLERSQAVEILAKKRKLF